MKRLALLAVVAALAGCGSGDPEPASPGAATTGQTSTEQSDYYER